MNTPNNSASATPAPKNIAPSIESIRGKEYGGNGHTEEVDYGPRYFDEIHQKEIANSFGDTGAVDRDTRHYLSQSSGVVGPMASTSAGSGSGPSQGPGPSGASKDAVAAGTGKDAAATGRQPITQNLIALLEESELGHFGSGAPNLKDWLSQSIKTSYIRGVNAYPPSGILNVQTLAEYYDFVDQRVQDLPHETHSGAFLQTVCEWHWPLSQEIEGFGEGTIQIDYNFAMWMTNWADAWGTFLNGSGSLRYLKSFIEDSAFNIDEYIVPSGGFQSFNEFFAREVKPGERPVASPDDQRVVVSPADSVPQGVWPISDSSTIINSKGMTYSIQEILGDLTPEFADGVFTHTFLNVFDYHRYRVPVSGKVVGIRQFVKQASLTVEPVEPPGSGSYPQDTLTPIDGTGFQFTQTRSMVVIDTAGYANVGLVIAMPMGMAMVSSCNITLTLGQIVEKGDELGYFLFGGSDYVMIFQSQANFKIKDGIVGEHTLACAAYGNVSDTPLLADYEPPAEATTGWSGKRSCQ